MKNHAKAFSVSGLVALCILSTSAWAFAHSPCPRNQPTIVFHQGEGAIFLFGGFCSDSKSKMNDLWKFEDGQWHQVLSDRSPQARSGHALVYDPADDRLVLFGGKNDNAELLKDTWSWDGSDWQLISESGPEARQSHRLAPTRSGILLFGGSDAEGNSLADTWTLRGTEWQRVHAENTPPARRQHTLSFDQNKGTVVLFGGFDRIADDKVVLGDTWEYDGTNWTLMDSNPILSRDHHAAAYDHRLKRIVMFGGYKDGYLGDTWQWNGQSWQELNTNGPSRAGKPGLVYDIGLGSLILFGGWDSENAPLMDFWKFDPEPNSWSEL